MTEELILECLNVVWRRWPCALLRKCAMLVLDSFRGHITEKVKAKVNRVSDLVVITIIPIKYVHWKCCPSSCNHTVMQMIPNLSEMQATYLCSRQASYRNEMELSSATPKCAHARFCYIQILYVSYTRCQHEKYPDSYKLVITYEKHIDVCWFEIILASALKSNA
jgi:hypothetical protein